MNMNTYKYKKQVNQRLHHYAILSIVLILSLFLAVKHNRIISNETNMGIPEKRNVRSALAER